VAAAEVPENYMVENTVYQLRQDTHAKPLNKVSVFSLTEYVMWNTPAVDFKTFSVQKCVICLGWGYSAETFSAQNLSAIIKQLERGYGRFIFLTA